MSEVSHSAEWSALERTITNKFGAGHGTTVLLGLLKKLHDSQPRSCPREFQYSPSETIVEDPEGVFTWESTGKPFNQVAMGFPDVASTVHAMPELLILFPQPEEVVIENTATSEVTESSP